MSDDEAIARTGIGLLTGSSDKKCPFTGMVSIRGRILTGTVVSTKMHRTLIIRREYLHFIPKYARYEKRHKNLAAHVSPAFRVEEGDQVTVGQCRPLSKTVSDKAHAQNTVLTESGSIQCSSSPPTHWQSGEAIQQVLSITTVEKEMNMDALSGRDCQRDADFSKKAVSRFQDRLVMCTKQL